MFKTEKAAPARAIEKSFCGIWSILWTLNALFGFFLAHHIEATFSLGMFADFNLYSGLYNCLRHQHSGAAGLIGSVVFWVVPPGVTSSVLLNHIMVLGSGCRGSSCPSSFSSGHTSANICITHTSRSLCSKASRRDQMDVQMGHCCTPAGPFSSVWIQMKYSPLCE